MQPLITRNDIAQYRQISNTPHDAKLNEQILDAQLLDLQPLIGEKLYNAVTENPENYTALLNGETYIHKGITYKNYGLKMVLCYYAYARYVMFGSAIDTPFSVIEKLNDNSRPAEASSKKNIYGINRDAAFQLWQNVRLYLIRTQDVDFRECIQNKNTGFRIKKLQ